jgi:hypothetical protein
MRDFVEERPRDPAFVRSAGDVAAASPVVADDIESAVQACVESCVECATWGPSERCRCRRGDVDAE